MPLSFASCSSLIIHCWLLLLAAQCYQCSVVSLSFDVKPGGRDCFYQDMNQGVQYELEYQVWAGGELDINFVMQTPNGNSIFFGDRKQNDAHRSQAAESGEYVFCFDNTFSHISTKTVFFQLVIHDDAIAVTGSHSQDESELSAYEITLESFKKSMDAVKESVEKSIQLQRQFSSIELRDRSIQEFNFERINFWSGLQLFVMCSVGLVNVLMIRGLFDDRRQKVTPNTTKIRT